MNENEVWNHGKHCWNLQLKIIFFFTILVGSVFFFCSYDWLFNGEWFEVCSKTFIIGSMWKAYFWEMKTNLYKHDHLENA